MVAKTQKNFSAHYAWFSRGRSHIGESILASNSLLIFNWYTIMSQRQFTGVYNRQPINTPFVMTQLWSASISSPCVSGGSTNAVEGRPRMSWIVLLLENRIYIPGSSAHSPQSVKVVQCTTDDCIQKAWPCTQVPAFQCCTRKKVGGFRSHVKGFTITESKRSFLNIGRVFNVKFRHLFFMPLCSLQWLFFNAL